MSKGRRHRRNRAISHTKFSKRVMEGRILPCLPPIPDYQYTTVCDACSAWNNCSTNVQREGCTFYDLHIQVLRRYYHWSVLFNLYDANQQHYNDAIDSLSHLCNNIEPGTVKIEAGSTASIAGEEQYAQSTGTGLIAVSYTHLTLPTKRIV